MRLATVRNGLPDGQLVVVAQDGLHAAPAAGIAATLQEALERWNEVEADLNRLGDKVDDGHAAGRVPIDATNCAAPLPRAWQWLDGSAYPNHGELMQRAFKLPPIATDRPLMYQGLSDRFLGPFDDVLLPSEDDGIDFEGEIGVIVDFVPMGTKPADALRHIRLVIQINDWSLRTIAPIEMKTGFGWVQAKPACSAAPFAVTPDALGSRWRDGRLSAIVEIDLNDRRFGRVDSGAEMQFGFDELVAHAARTRDLVAGTIIGSGTVSATNYRDVGSSCIAERRAIEAIADRPLTPFLRFGDRVRMNARVDGRGVFGCIDQQVKRAAAPAPV